MANPIYEYELTILEQHLDTFGHVNNAVYLTLYEEARWDFITKNNLGLKEILDKKIGPVLLDVQLTFKAELVDGHRLIVKVTDDKGEDQIDFGMVKVEVLHAGYTYKSSGDIAKGITVKL